MIGCGDDMFKPLPLAQIELIAVDLDGTLLRRDSSLSGKSLDAVRQAKKKGIRIIVASTRPPRSALKFYQAMDLDTWQINHNGALIYDQVNKNSIDHQPIEGPIAQRVMHLDRQVVPDIPIGIEVIDTLYTDRVGYDPNASHAGVTDTSGSVEAVLQHPVTKIFMTGNTQQLADIQMILQQKLLGKMNFAISHQRLLKVVGPHVNKVHALQKVAAHYGIPRERVMAIGDVPNDLEMMKWAGLGIAVKNGWADVRSEAHFVVPSNDDDGVAQAIIKYAL